SAFLLNGILRGQDEKRIGQAVAGATYGHLSFLHRFEESGLCLGRCAVDFVSKNHVGKKRAMQEFEGALAGGLVVLKNLGAGDVRRHEVGSELNAAEAEV